MYYNMKIKLFKGENSMCIKIHENTIKKAMEIIKNSEKQGLRVKTNGSSCSGVNFEIFPDNINENDDYVITDKSGIKIILDRNIKNMFSDAIIEYKQTMVGWEFKIY